MTVKERVLAFVHSWDEDITIDQMIDELYLFKKLERALAQADSGDEMDHDEFMNQLQAEDEEDPNKVDKGGSRGSRGNKKVHRSRRTSDRAGVR